MQKDTHFYLTYALARRVGIGTDDAEIIAWADQYTDDMTENTAEDDKYGIQTQCGKLDNWEDRQIQLTVLIPFHFLPGFDPVDRWKTESDNPRARELVGLAQNNLYRLGIALHAYQDTFSHEGFSGWREPLNSCYDWYYLESVLPNVGHAEMRVIPDVTNYVWTDPRSGNTIDNKERALAAAKGTFDFLAEFFPPANSGIWSAIKADLTRLFALTSYNDRVTGLCELSGDREVHYDNVRKRLEGDHKDDFASAAAEHLSSATALFKGLPLAQ